MTFVVPVLSVAVVTAIARLFGADVASAALLLLLAVVASALFGLRSGLIATVLATFAYNVVFVPPTGDLRVDKVSDLVALVVFGVVALVVGLLVARETRLRLTAEQHREEAGLSSTKAAFFAATGHNLRTPLATVMTAVDSLLTSGDDLDAAQHQELLESIRGETQRLSLLVSRSLELGRVREGGLAPQPEPVEVVGLVQAAVRRLGAATAARCRYDARDQDATVLADIAMTEEILTVLIENAVTYAPSSSPIEVVVTAHDTWIDTAVVDHGPGVDAADTDRIFGEYVRGASAQHTTGTGLGLAVARALAEAQAGTVTFSPTSGGGATFTLRLPAATDTTEELHSWPGS